MTDITAELQTKRVLHVGCGPKDEAKLHPIFRGDSWSEVRVDVDKRARPDLELSVTNLEGIPSGQYDAFWCSHILEHLDEADVRTGLAELHRVLKPSGFGLITCPDLFEIAKLILEGREDDVAYTSPAGDVRAIDMLFGFQPAIAAGNYFMRHNTGFTRRRIGRMMHEANFTEVRVIPGRSYDLWAVAFREETNQMEILQLLRNSGLNFI